MRDWADSGGEKEDVQSAAEPAGPVKGKGEGRGHHAAGEEAAGLPPSPVSVLDLATLLASGEWQHHRETYHREQQHCEQQQQQQERVGGAEATDEAREEEEESEGNDDWVAVADGETDDIYWYRPNSGEITWDDPTGDDSTMADPTVANAFNDDDAQQQQQQQQQEAKQQEAEGWWKGDSGGNEDGNEGGGKEEEDRLDDECSGAELEHKDAKEEEEHTDVKEEEGGEEKEETFDSTERGGSGNEWGGRTDGGGEGHTEDIEEKVETDVVVFDEDFGKEEEVMRKIGEAKVEEDMEEEVGKTGEDEEEEEVMARVSPAVRARFDTFMDHLIELSPTLQTSCSERGDLRDLRRYHTQQRFSRSGRIEEDYTMA